MGLNKRRVWIVVGVTALMTVSAIGLYAVRFRNRQEASNLEASAQSYLEKGDFASAKIEADKLLAIKPQLASAHVLRGRILLAGREPSSLRASIPEDVAPIRSFLQATRLDPELLEPRKLLVDYFLSAGDMTEAGNHARAVLRHEPDQSDARYALASSLLESNQSREAADHAEYLIDHESPVRPRTAWLCARLGDLNNRQGRENLLRDKATALLKQFDLATERWDAVDDQLALVELRAWQARRSDDIDQVRSQTDGAISQLRAMMELLERGAIPARLLVGASERLLPAPNNRSNRLRSVYDELQPKVDELTEEIYTRAIAKEIHDPAIYVSYAAKLRDQGRGEDAVQAVQAGIAASKKASSEIRNAFVLCDLWLAEHFLSNRQGEMAQPHLDALLASQHLKAWGQLLTGYHMVQKSDFEDAAKHLEQAVVSMPENGTANALLGLCQLRRGFVTEGRSYLEKGIRLGANEPQYKAWLSMALSEAGYQDQAMNIAQQVLADQTTSGLGKALLGQLRLRAGDYDQAARDFAGALESADESFRPSLKLSQAELAIVRNDWETAQKLLDELKETPLAPQAYSVEFRHLRRTGQEQAADELLETAKATHPDSMLLLAMNVSNLVQKKRHSEAIDLLVAEKEKFPASPSPHLLLSEVYELQDKADKALETLHQASKKFPEEAALKIRLAERLLTAQKFHEAATVLADLKGDPKVNPATLDYLLARSASMQGEYAKAEAIVKQAAEKDPDNPTLKFLQGQIAVKQGDYATASQLFEQSMAGGSFREQTIHALFESLLRSGETDRAIELLGRAQQQGFSVGRMRGKMLQLLARREKWELLERELEKLIQNDPGEDDFSLAISLLRFMNRQDKARELVDLGLTRFPESMSLREHEISLLIEQEKHAQAETLLADLLDKHPQNHTLHILNVACLLETDRLDDAIAATSKGWEHCPGNRALAALRVQVLLQKGENQKALEFAQKAKREHADLPSPRYLMARMYEAIGEEDKALTYLGSTVSAEPTNEQAAEHYLRMLLNQGPPADFVKQVEQLVAANPENPVLLGVLTEYHVSRGQLDEARLVIKRIESMRQVGPLASYLKALVAYTNQNFDEAERSLTIALADPRGHIPSTFLLARTRVSQRRFDEALELLNQVCRQRPGLVSARQLQVQLLVKQRRLDDAEQSCRKYLESHPRSRPIQQLLAEVLLEQGGESKKAEAFQIAKSGLQEGIENPSQFASYVNILLACDQREMALKVLDAAESRNQQDLVLAGSRSLLANGDIDKAHEIAARLYRRSPEDVESLLLLADAVSRLAKRDNDEAGFQNAAQHYREVLRLQKGNLVAANNLAWTIGVHLGSPHRGLEEMQRALPQTKSADAGLPAEVLDTVGMLHMRMGHLDEAQQYLELATAKKPEAAALHFNLGLVYQKQNRATRASQSFAEAQRLDPKGGWDARLQQLMAD